MGSGYGLLTMRRGELGCSCLLSSCFYSSFTRSNNRPGGGEGEAGGDVDAACYCYAAIGGDVGSRNTGACSGEE